MTYAYMKTSITDYKDGQDDILSMDDELPLTIFIGFLI